MSHRQHLTTRRAFITTLGFSGMALYGAWAAYGAAPLPFIHSPSDDVNAPAQPSEVAQAHGGHGGGGVMSPEEFTRRHEEFIARFEQPDGSVALTSSEVQPPAGTMQHGTAVGHHLHGAGGDSGADPHLRPASVRGSHGAATLSPEGQEPVDIYLLAYRFGFAPDEIRVRAGETYRFRMMASDITHGASLQLGHGSRIIRLRPNVVSEQAITFKRPGTVLVYCTVFCGPAHDAMKGRILVTS